jgi:O-antigen/teichoic acid export membrane protein
MGVGHDEGRAVRTMRRLRQALRSPATLYLMTQVMGRVGGILVLPIYTRRLSLEELGHLALAQTLVAVLAPTVCSGLTTAVIRAFFDDPDRDVGSRLSGGLVRWMTLQVLGVSALLALLVMVANPHFGFVDRDYLLTVIAGASGASLLAACLGHYRASQRLRAVMLLNVLDLLQTTVFPLLLVLHLGRGYQGALASLALGGLVTTSVSTAIAWLAMRGWVSRQRVLAGIRFGVPVLLQFYGMWITTHADRWFLQFHGFAADVGRYSVGRQLSSPGAMVVGAFVDAEYPRVGEQFREGGLPRVGQMLPRLQRLLFWVSAALPAALVLGYPILYPIIGKEAALGVLLAPILSINTVIDSQLHPYQWVLFFGGRMQALKFSAAASLVLTVLGGLLVVPWLGVPGALATQGVASVARFFILRWAAHQALRSASDHPPR